MARQLRPWRADLAYKHEMMAANPLSFLRGTFYRWAELWSEHCREEADAPVLLAVGDVHVENYGTWRDVEGRLVWGLNDFDEATPLPYTQDLVRLVASARLAIQLGRLRIRFREASAAVLSGYRECLHAGGRPLVLAETDLWLRRIATSRLRDPVVFWKQMADHPALTEPPRGEVNAVLLAELPAGTTEVRWLRRRAGVGSLGRPRLAAMAQWQGGLIAREAKSLLPSAWGWRNPGLEPSHYNQVLDAAVRCPDPGLGVAGGWITRRLAPDCSRVELASLPVKRDEYRLLKAMGWELANIHLGSPLAIPLVIEDLGARPDGWLRRAGKTMAEATFADWKEWRASRS